MKLSFHADATDQRRYPHGYWYVVTDDGGWDADGPDPLTAVSNLVLVLEQEMSSHALGCGHHPSR